MTTFSNHRTLPYKHRLGRFMRVFSLLTLCTFLALSTLHCFPAQPRICIIDENATHPTAPGIPFSPSCTPDNVDPLNAFCLLPEQCGKPEQRKGPYTCVTKRCVQIPLDKTGKPYTFRALHDCYPTALPAEGLKGNCRIGKQRSVLNGALFSACFGAIAPVPLEQVTSIKDELQRCARTDETCDGTPDPPAKDCPCGPVGTTRYCYPGSRNDLTPNPEAIDGKNQNTFCRQGIQVCEADPSSKTAEKGFWGPCQGFRLPSNDPCSGFDGDCDGITDTATLERNCLKRTSEGFSKEPITNTASANAQGDSFCTVEGHLDYSFHRCGDCIEGELRACRSKVVREINGQATCAEIYQICQKQKDKDGKEEPLPTWSPCQYDANKETLTDWSMPKPESLSKCDQIDNDCDGKVDNFPGKEDHSLRIGCGDKDSEKVVSVGGASFGKRQFCGQIACTKAGNETCEPFSETCNGIDDDCDGLIDNVSFCLVGAELGANFCENNAPSGTCTKVEICNNGKDDNNNGQTDEESCLKLK